MINDKAKSQLTQLSANEAEYTKMLEKLWIQACFQLLEDDTVVTCREKDVSLLQVRFQGSVGQRNDIFFSLSQETSKQHIKKRRKRI